MDCRGETAEWPLKGISRIKPQKKRVTLEPGKNWQIEKFKIVRLSRPGNRVAIRLTYRRKNDSHKTEKVLLEAKDDFGQSNAEHSVKGLPVECAFHFVLFLGTKKS